MITFGLTTYQHEISRKLLDLQSMNKNAWVQGLPNLHMQTLSWDNPCFFISPYVSIFLSYINSAENIIIVLINYKKYNATLSID